MTGEAVSGTRDEDGHEAAEAGRVVKSFGGWYDVSIPGGVVSCRPRGRLLHRREDILTGDRVRVSRLHQGRGVIEAVLPRTNRLLRPPVANVDQVVVVTTLVEPPLNRPLLDRIAVLAEHQGLDVVVVVNKADLAPTAGVKELAEAYAPAGYPVVVTSARAGAGIDSLRELMMDKVSVLAGASGVGKSTLLNALQPGLGLETGDVSPRLRRGRHTTRHAQLLPLTGPEGRTSPAGFVVDTPGFSRLDVTEIHARELLSCFPEMEPLAARCRFDDCLHRAEPGCAVKEAVNQGRVDAVRYRHYLDLLGEIEEADRLRYR